MNPVDQSPKYIYAKKKDNQQEEDSLKPMEASDIKTTLAVIKNDQKYMSQKLDSIDGKLSQQYVTKDELALVTDKVSRLEKIVYGVITLILTAVIGTAMTLLLRK